MNIDASTYIVFGAVALAVIAAVIVGVRVVSRSRLAKRVAAMSPAERERYTAVTAATTAVKAAERAHRAAVRAKESKVAVAEYAVKSAERIGRRHLTTISSKNTISKNKMKLYENELRTGDLVVPLHGLTMRLVHFGSLTTTSRPTLTRTLAGAAIGHAVGSELSNRRGTATGLGIAGALIGSNIEKSSTFDGRSTTIHFEFDGEPRTAFTAWADDRKLIDGFCTAVTRAQQKLHELETERTTAIAKASAVLAAAVAEPAPAVALAAADTARSVLAQLSVEA